MNLPEPRRRPPRRRSPHRARLTTVLLGLAGLAGLAAVGSANAQGATLERHPYLQMATSTSVTIVWTTLEGSAGIVEYGLAPDELTISVPSERHGNQHEVVLEGLRPNTRYYYRVLSDHALLAGGDEHHTFLTPPPAGTPAKFRAWIVGDSGTGGDKQMAVRDAMLAHVGPYLPELFLHLGDMAYNSGTYLEFSDNFYTPYQDLLQRMTIWPTLGNHEGYTADSQTQTGAYFDGYVLPAEGQAGGLPSGTEAYYSFDYANVHFIVLDSYDSPREPEGAMLIWLGEDLRSTEQEWIIAYWHHPTYSKGSHNSDVETVLIEMRENVLPLLEAGGVDLVLAGHSHIYERSYLLDSAYQTPSEEGVGVLDDGDGRVDGDGPYLKPPGLSSHQGAVYVVAGHGGTSVSGQGNHPLMFFSEVDHGSCLLDIDDNRLSLINVRHDGEVTDRMAIIKGEGLMLAYPDGGEVFLGGDPMTIEWTSVGPTSDVQLEYSLDDGERWSLITASTPNTGRFDWQVPMALTERALVRVSDASDPVLRDESNAGFSITDTLTLTPIDFGHTWRYHDQGEDLGDAWLSPEYDDYYWSNGAGELGYGEYDEQTRLFDADPNFPSVYLRTTIELPTNTLRDAQLTAKIDDGLAVWVNGRQVFGFLVGNGTDYSAWASGEHEDTDLVSGPIDPSAFRPGTNVVTAILKPSSGEDNDLSFDLRLTLTANNDATPGGEDGADGGSGVSDTGPLSGTSSTTSGGSTSAGVNAPPGGCGCTTTTGTAGWLLGGGFLLLGGRRRRRRRRHG